MEEILGDDMETWEDVIQVVPLLNAHEKIKIKKSTLPPMPKSFNWRIGHTLNEYSMPLEDGRGIHVRVLPEHYVLEWDYADANTDPIGHIKKDASGLDKIAIALTASVILDQLFNNGRYRKKLIRKITRD